MRRHDGVYVFWIELSETGVLTTFNLEKKNFLSDTLLATKIRGNRIVKAFNDLDDPETMQALGKLR